MQFMLLLCVKCLHIAVWICGNLTIKKQKWVLQNSPSTNGGEVKVLDSQEYHGFQNVFIYVLLALHPGCTTAVVVLYSVITFKERSLIVMNYIYILRISKY